ncbi:MAG: copper-translocating P-type ATPase, partial [Xanthobacteraceae bacterium]
MARRQLYPAARHYHARPRHPALRRTHGAWMVGSPSGMTASGNMICSHCLLPVGLRAMRRAVNGEDCAFCCYGCCIAFQVKNGKSEEWEAAWLLIRLGVGGFLSMNIMLFSLLLYTDTFTGVDARLIP